jgi:hypothetical protein
MYLTWNFQQVYPGLSLFPREWNGSNMYNASSLMRQDQTHTGCITIDNVSSFIIQGLAGLGRTFVNKWMQNRKLKDHAWTQSMISLPLMIYLIYFSMYPILYLCNDTWAYRLTHFTLKCISLKADSHK